jgi:hypothetical protein
MKTQPWRKLAVMNLAEWNKQREQYWRDVRRKVTHPEEFANGFECPECKGALYDTGQVQSTSPTILRVRCQSCNFRGTRYE